MREHWQRLIGDSERRAEAFLATQINDPSSSARGGTPTPWGIPDPKPTMNAAATAMACYLNPDSRLKDDPRIPAAYGMALDFAIREMNPDGTFDYPYCNFRSAPDTAFIINRVFVTRALIARACEEAGAGSAVGATGAALPAERAAPAALAGLLGRIDELLERAGSGIMAGGFHTPNHRWACAAALSSCHRLTGKEEFREAAERYLLEGIDINEDGEYAERSSGGYNVVNNDQMIVLARTRGESGFLDYVERNLEMMFAYVDPDGTIFTGNSTRQDRGARTWPDNYHFHYLFMARERGRADFAAMARRIMDGIIAAGREAPDFLDQTMLYLGGIDYGASQVGRGAETTERGAAEKEPTGDFRRLFRGSGIVRGRMGDFSYSILGNDGHFLVAQSGRLRAILRLGVGFFERRDFVPSSLEKEGEDFVLRLRAEGWYYLPFREKPATSDWWAMDNAKRERLHGPDLEFELRVGERAERDGIDLRLRVEGWKDVPLRLEIGLSPGAELESERFCLETRPGEAILAKSGDLILREGLDALSIGPAFAQHRNMGGTYGSETRSRELFSLYFTALTPVDRVVSFRRLDPRRTDP